MDEELTKCGLNLFFIAILPIALLLLLLKDQVLHSPNLS